MLQDQFDYIPNDDDPTVDPMWELKTNPDVYIQDCRGYGGGYVVNKLIRENGEIVGTTYIEATNNFRMAMMFAQAHS